MRTWYAKEWWFLQRLTRGIRSSVGILALLFRPLYNNMSLLSRLRFLRDSHFKCSRMSAILPVPCYKSSGSILNFFELVLKASFFGNGWMEWILLTQTRNVGSVTKNSPMEYLSVWQVLGNLGTAEVLRNYVASNPQMEHIWSLFSSWLGISKWTQVPGFTAAFAKILQGIR